MIISEFEIGVSRLVELAISTKKKIDLLVKKGSSKVEINKLINEHETLVKEINLIK